MGTEPPRQRDAERSRAAILDAAETLFAANGFESVTMAQVGAQAGVSRGTPGYFFGSKEALYRTVLDRAVAELAALGQTLRSAAAGRGTDAAIGDAVDAFLSFALTRPSRVRLIDARSAAGAGSAHAEAMADALAGLGPDGGPSVLAVLALCWFPVSQPGAARRLGVDPDRPDFARVWRDHVVTAVGGGARPPQAAPSEAAGARPPSARVEPDVDRPQKKKKRKKNKGKG